MGSLIGSTFRDTLAIQYNGTTQRSVKDSPTIDGDNAGGFAFWFRPTTVPTSAEVRTMIGLGSSTAGNNATLSIHVRWNSFAGTAARFGIFTRRVNGSSNLSDSYGSTSLSAGTLYHVVVQSNGSAWSIYVNGVAETMSNFLTSDGANPGHWFSDIGITNKRMSVGARTFDGNTDNFFDCKVNEMVYVSGRVFTASEITSLYNSGTPRNPYRITSLFPDLKIWYRFGDSRDTASTVFDEIGSDDNLTNVNSPSYVTP